MNRRELQKNVGKVVLVWPGGDKWRIERADDVVELKHVATDHILRLGSDSIQDSREPHSLILRGRAMRQGRRCRLEPFVYGDPYVDLWVAAEQMRQFAIRAGVNMPPLDVFLAPRPNIIRRRTKLTKP